MAQFMACFRATHVGGHTAKMDHLRGLNDPLGFANVETLIAGKYQ